MSWYSSSLFLNLVKLKKKDSKILLSAKEKKKDIFYKSKGVLIKFIIAKEEI